MEINAKGVEKLCICALWAQGARLRRRLWPAAAGRLCKRVVNERVLRFDARKADEGS
jgi:hypothetical protein